MAEITLVPFERGGRLGPILQGEYRGILGVGSEHFSVRFFVPTPGGLTPSTEHRLGVQFLFPEAALPHFQVGTTFTVWEGRIIGNGKVIEVLRHV